MPFRLRKSNLKRREEAKADNISGKKMLDFEPVEVDKKVVKIKEKIKKRRDMMKALPKRKGEKCIHIHVYSMYRTE